MLGYVQDLVSIDLIVKLLKLEELIIKIIYNLVINPILINSYTTISFIIKQSYKEHKVEVKAKIYNLEY